jgi:AraC-like DNA-binding protein
MLEITSIIKNVVASPIYSAKWGEEGKQEFILIEAKELIFIEYKKKRVALEKGSFAIGSCFRVLNVNSRPVEFNIVTFRNVEHGIIKKVFILKNKVILNVFSSLISNATCCTIKLNEATRVLEEIVSLSTINEKANDYAAQLPLKIDNRLILVNRYIRHNYYEPITLQMLADMVHTTSIHLCNTYSRVFRISPMKYLQEYRIKKAQEVLVETRLTIKQIANDVGYISPSQFATYFKRYTGISPIEYRIKYTARNSCSLNIQQNSKVIK